MRINDKGIELIKSFEGCSLVSYKCPAGVWTIGYGHTNGVTEGMSISQKQAEQFLKEDLARFEKCVENAGLELNENQFSALVSFAYNCGNGNLKKLIANRTLPEIAEALLLYVKANGVVLNGIVRRRKAERELFLMPVEECKGEVEKVSKIVKYYSKSKEGNVQLSANFKVKEFACKDGSDVVFISPELVEILQKIRNYFGKAVNINSAYRTPTYNKKVGGATYSQHCYGTAADIRITGIPPKGIANYAETLMPDYGGIGIYKNFVHIDVREEKSRWNG